MTVLVTSWKCPVCGESKDILLHVHFGEIPYVPTGDASGLSYDVHVCLDEHMCDTCGMTSEIKVGISSQLNNVFCDYNIEMVCFNLGWTDFDLVEFKDNKFFVGGKDLTLFLEIAAETSSEHAILYHYATQHSKISSRQ